MEATFFIKRKTKWASKDGQCGIWKTATVRLAVETRFGRCFGVRTGHLLYPGWTGGGYVCCVSVQRAKP